MDSLSFHLVQISPVRSCTASFTGTQITETDVYTLYNGSPATWIETKYDQYGNVIEVKSYSAIGGFGGRGTLVSDKLIYYGQSWNGSSCTAYPSGYYILTTPCYAKLLNSSGAIVAQTQITYSNTGHPTSTSKWVSGSNSLTTTATYNSNGTVNRATDANGTYFQYSYGTGGCNSLEPTGVTIVGTGVNLSRSMTWDCNGGVQTSLTDENGNTTHTNFTYNGVADPFYRPVSVVDPVTNTTTFGYTFSSFESAMNFNGSVSTTDTLITADGLARDIFEQKRQGQGSSAFDSTQTVYGWESATTGACTTQPPFTFGACTTQSMPYAGTQAQGAPSGTKVTTTQYDALGRPLTVVDGGGGTTTYKYSKNDVLITVSPAPSGENTKQKQFEYDGLGRLTSVCEVTAGTTAWPGGTCAQTNALTGYWTKYTYDAMGNLLTVTQNAQGTSQTRTYTYDGLSRLTSETNPEWGPGTANYTYDVACGTYSASSGDMTKKVDSAGNTTCYAYDGLHRLTDAGNSGPTCRHFRYDKNVTPPSGITVSNTEATLEEAYTDACSGSKITDEWFGYDADGRMTDVYQSTPHSGTPYYHTSACYWPNGTMGSLSGIPGVPAISYGAGSCPTSGNGLDGEGRVTQVTAASGTNPASNVSYSPTTTSTALAGSLTGISFPSGDGDSFTFDPTTGRQTGYTFSVNQETDTGSLHWNANGTLGKLGIVDNLPGSADSQNCNYYYDDLGRLGGVDSNGYSVDCGSIWSQLFAFDPFGNIQKSGSITFAATYSAATNRYTLSGVNVQYDGNGNLLTDNLNTYTWDPNFGNLASVNGINLIYDALGQMVEQQNGSAYKEILYSPAGKTAVMNGQTLTKAFLYLPGGVRGIYNSSGLAYYRHSDWLGSSRLTSTATAPTSPYSISAYAPFGEQYDVSGTSDPSFTGQNSDTVSSLYDFTFREHSPSQGRWISPDPAGLSAADPTNPQSWNRYAYVLNNPLIYRDPLGLYCAYLNDAGDGVQEIDDDGDEGGCNQNGGYWIEGSYGAGSSVNINVDSGIVTGLGYDSSGNPEVSIAGASGSNPWGAWTQTFSQVGTLSFGSNSSWFLEAVQSFFGGFSLSTKPGTCLGKFVDTATAPLKQVRSAVQYYIPIAVSALQSAPTLTTTFGSYMRMAGSFSSTAPSETAQDIAALYTVGALASQAAPLVKTATPYGIVTAADGVLLKGLVQEVKAGMNGQCTW